ncbi:hypothetical protein ACFQ07_20985, partial [Actinomadura adrarensis]
ATRCPSAPPGPSAPSQAADCLWTQEFTVTGVRLSKKRGETDRAYLTDANGDRWTADADKDPILAGLDEGDRITGTIWRGEITEISADGDTQRTYDAPADMGTRAFIGALIVIPPGMLAVTAGLWRLVCIRRPDTAPGIVAAQGLAIALFMTGLFSPIFAAGEQEDFSNTLIAWLVMAAIAFAVAIGYVSHERSRKAEKARAAEETEAAATKARSV